MSKLLSRVGLAMIVLSTLLVSPSVVLADPDTTNCLYPTPADRFGVTVYADQQIGDFDVTPLAAARYLNWRINRQVNAEDTALITRVQEGMASRTFSMGPLSDKEVCLKSFCARIRSLIPEAAQEQRPAPGWSHK